MGISETSKCALAISEIPSVADPIIAAIRPDYSQQSLEKH
jgi:hypothetical protein